LVVSRFTVQLWKKKTIKIQSDNFLKTCGRAGLHLVWTSRAQCLGGWSVRCQRSLCCWMYLFTDYVIHPLFHVLFCRSEGSSSLQKILSLLSDTFVPINQTIRDHSSERRNGHDSLTVHPEKEGVTTAIIRKFGVRILRGLEL